MPYQALGYMKYSPDLLKAADHCQHRSFTTGVACVNLDRKFIGIEMDEKYFEIGSNRVLEAVKEKSDESTC